MEILKTKFWPDAKPPEGAEYIGSISEGSERHERYDLYLRRHDVHFYSHPNWGHYTVNVVAFAASNSVNEWHVAAQSLVDAHRAQQAKPAMTREEKVAAIARAGYERFNSAMMKWDNAPQTSKKIWNDIAVAQLHATDPAPVAPPVKEKTPGEMVADFLRVFDIDGKKWFGLDDSARHVSLKDEWADSLQEKSARKFIKAKVDAALAAQAATLAEKHRKELEGLRERCAAAARNEGYSTIVENVVRNVPLTL